MLNMNLRGNISIKMFCDDGNISYICNVIKSDI
nr:MAG TPA: hypothetical protein [Caudoviricetes sp.]